MPIFALMKRIPLLVRWILATAIFFMAFMFLLRMLTFVILKQPGDGVSQMVMAFWRGFRFDIIMVGIVSLLLLLTGSIQSLHPFETKAGKSASKVLLFVFIVVLVIFYMFDVVHYRYISRPLELSALSLFEDPNVFNSISKKAFPLFRLTMIFSLIVFILWRLVNVIFRVFALQKH